MIALAIICLLVAAALVALMIAVGFTVSVTFHLIGGNLVTVRPIWIFVLGAVTLLVALVGLSLLSRGTRRKVERRREIRRLRKVEQEAQGPRSGGRRSAGDAEPTAADDAPDRTLVRERERTVDVRTTPGDVGTSSTSTSSTGASSTGVTSGDDPQAGPRQRQL